MAAILPLPQVAAATSAARVPKTLYVWAVAMARAGNPISTETLGHALKVSSDDASALIGRLVSRGVVDAPNALGVARAVNPMFKNSGFVTKVARAPNPDAGKFVQKAFERLAEREDHARPPNLIKDRPQKTKNDPEVTTLNDDSVLPEVSSEARSTE